MATDVEQHVKVETENGIGWIRLNRPEKMNAIGALTRRQWATRSRTPSATRTYGSWS